MGTYKITERQIIGLIVAIPFLKAWFFNNGMDKYDVLNEKMSQSLF